jgi:hypothetical protein
VTTNHVGDVRRLPVTFEVDGTPTDPDNLVLTLTNPAGDATELVYLTDPEVVRDSEGVFHADVLLDTAGIWRWYWLGDGAAAGADDGAFTVRPRLADSAMLTTVDAVKQEIEDTSTEDDDLIERLIVAASAAVIRYTGRNFAPFQPTATARTFLIGDEGTVLIDDLGEAPTAISLNYPDGSAYGSATDLDADFIYLPYNRTGIPITTIRLGATLGAWPAGSTVTVTGRWGWPEVPPDVEHATILVVREWLAKSDAEWGLPTDITAAGIDTSGSPTRFRFPMAAKQILDQYRDIGIWIA